MTGGWSVENGEPTEATSEHRELLRSAQEWCDLHGIRVLDPDGWDRSNLAESWAERITFAEFRNRIGISTCYVPPGFDWEAHL